MFDRQIRRRRKGDLLCENLFFLFFFFFLDGTLCENLKLQEKRSVLIETYKASLPVTLLLISS